jgi:hypothetical protein
MMPAAPGFCSTMKDWPIFWPSWLAMSRATWSVGPPAVKPTTIFTGLFG